MEKEFYTESSEDTEGTERRQSKRDRLGSPSLEQNS
jgi:hypothetical protein